MNNLFQSLNPNQPIPQSQNKNLTIQDIVTEVQKSGMTPEELFYKKAREQNANVDSILQQARMMASNFR